MKKKLALMGLGVAVGSLLLISSAYAGIGDAPGYDAYKSAVKNTLSIQNVTRNISVSVEDNGAALLSLNSTIKSASGDKMGSANVDVKNGSTEQTIQLYNQDGKHIVKTSGSDVYQIIDAKNGKAEFKKHLDQKEQLDPAMAQEMENIVDSLVGNLKNYVSLDEANGVKDIHFQLSGSQIPTVVNTIGSVIVKKGANEKVHSLQPSETLGVNVATLKDSLPKITQDIKIESVTMNASIDADNHITNQVAQIQISGKDAGGTAHEVIVKVNMGLSDFNNTKPDTVDLSGKKVETVKPFDKEAKKLGN
jgi:hypothetical protein